MTDTLEPVQVAHDPAQVGALLHKLDEIYEAVKAQGVETEATEIDQLYVVGGNFAAAGVIAFQYPRTWRYVEITLSAAPPATAEVALFDGNLQLSDAQNRHSHIAGPMQSDALAVVSSGGVTFRAFLNQTGYMTMYFSGAYTGYVNVRIRVLDNTQYHARRT